MNGEGVGKTLDYFDRFVTDLSAFLSLLITKLPMPEVSEEDLRATMVLCFLSRAETCLRSIHLLYRHHRVSDAQVLQRSLLDLYIHLMHTHQEDNIEEYWYYTLKKRSDAANSILNDPDTRNRLTSSGEKLFKESNAMYREICRRRGEIRWKRPDAKRILRGQKIAALNRMYDFGWDFSSDMVVHPVLDTGHMEYHMLVNSREAQRPDSSYYTSMQNSVEIVILLTSVAIAFYNTGRSFQVSGVAEECVIKMLDAMGAGNYDYEKALSLFLSLPDKGQLLVVGK